MDTLTAKDFDGDRLTRPGDWAVCFGADWCRFCMGFRRNHFAKLEGNAPFSVAWGDVTEMENPLWSKFNLDVVPVLIAFRNGAPVWRKDGIAGVGLVEKDVVALKEAFR